MTKDLIFEIKPKYATSVRLFKLKNIVIALNLAVLLSSFIVLFLLPQGIKGQDGIIIGFSLYIILCTLFFALLLFLDKKNFEVTSYKVYKDRVEFEEGFINHKFTVIKVEDIKEIHLDQSFIQRYAGLGTIRFITAANNAVNSIYSTGVSFDDIEGSKEIYTKVKQIHEGQ